MGHAIPNLASNDLAFVCDQPRCELNRIAWIQIQIRERAWIHHAS